MILDRNRLKAERVAKGYTQEYMANALGWETRTPYVKRELGLIDIGIDEFLAMAEILGYDETNLSIFFKKNVPEKER